MQYRHHRRNCHAITSVRVVHAQLRPLSHKPSAQWSHIGPTSGPYIQRQKTGAEEMAGDEYEHNSPRETVVSKKGVFESVGIK